MQAFRTWCFGPIRGLKRFFRELDLTTRATCDAEAFIGLMEVDWSGSESIGAADGTRAHTVQDADPLRHDLEFLPGGSIMALVSSDGEPGELPPDMPDGPLVVGEGPIGRRAAAFRRYWVARVYERYPRVVGDWSEASLACTRLYLCSIMKEARKYYVEDKQTDGSVKLRAVFRRGMTTMQIMACVDWIVTSAHYGTPAQAAQRAVAESMRPNWLMRMFGLHASRGVR